jgi:hypothetical protein
MTPFMDPQNQVRTGTWDPPPGGPGECPANGEPPLDRNPLAMGDLQ